ncbi:hypothetical protein BD626DRAFT_493026 [Schizophyllum amplum]|uniref:Uncharacterized protein n=1 Tax=Schizophyllum amplum TaxID=97359 RepID=A0A550CGE7_9AGAR|nr:hypothetical protein BD626DRAFT_493026 [Auriculariopsis ampla]
MSTPISKETAARSEQPSGHIIDPSTNDSATSYHPTMPSEVAQPTRTNSVPQQGSTQPGDGSEVHEKVPFKEQVIAAAKKTRGTVLGKEELKQEGQEILNGERSGLHGGQGPAK